MAERERKTADWLRRDYVLHISMPEGTEPPPDSWSGEALHAVAELEAEVERLRARVEEQRCHLIARASRIQQLEGEAGDLKGQLAKRADVVASVGAGTIAKLLIDNTSLIEAAIAEAQT